MNINKEFSSYLLFPYYIYEHTHTHTKGMHDTHTAVVKEESLWLYYSEEWRKRMDVAKVYYFPYYYNNNDYNWVIKTGNNHSLALHTQYQCLKINFLLLFSFIMFHLLVFNASWTLLYETTALPFQTNFTIQFCSIVCFSFPIC